MMAQNPNVLVTGTIRNVGDSLKKEFIHLNRELTKIANVTYFLVESDSNDQTRDVLEEIVNSHRRFEYISLGKLDLEIPNRISRIRYCRNKYVEYIRNAKHEQSFDYVFVADLDGMNGKISGKSIRNSIHKMEEWDALFSNQLFGYYDLLALRSPGWVEQDLISTTTQAQEETGNNHILFIRYLINQIRRQKNIYSKMRIIPFWNQVIKVDSAFGGFAIYKTEIFLKFDYSVETLVDSEECEHVTFHRKCVDAGYNLGINPRMINNWFNEYNLNKIVLIRLARDAKRFLNQSRRKSQ
jgi:hypothetical protein